MGVKWQSPGGIIVSTMSNSSATSQSAVSHRLSGWPMQVNITTWTTGACFSRPRTRALRPAPQTVLYKKRSWSWRLGWANDVSLSRLPTVFSLRYQRKRNTASAQAQLQAQQTTGIRNLKAILKRGGVTERQLLHVVTKGCCWKFQSISPRTRAHDCAGCKARGAPYDDCGCMENRVCFLSSSLRA